jgi:hypothetical protein
MTMRIPILLVLLLLAEGLSPATVSAAEQPAFFVVGDCVEYDTTNTFTAVRWRKGRVTEIDEYFITIELEQKINDLPLRVATNGAGKWLRTGKGCAAKAGAEAGAEVLPDGVPAPLPDVVEPEAPAPAPPPPPMAGPFSVGDCIEYDTTNRYQPELRWRKGRITAIDEFMVTIELDHVKSDLPTQVASATATKWLRAAKGCAPVKQQLARAGAAGFRLASFQSAPPAPPASVPAQPVAGLKCPLKQDKVSPQPSQAVLTDVIRCLWEKDTDIEVVRAHVDSFKVGQSRPWNERGDIGNGKAGTTVFPVRVDWRLIRYHRSSLQLSENVSVFNCFVNAFDEWECGLASRIRDGSIMTYRRPR